MTSVRVETDSGVRRVLGRYVLFQIPELLLAGTGLVVLVGLDVLTARWAWILFALWIAKEVVLFPLVRKAYEPSDPAATSRLIGATGVVIERLDREGRVRVGPELWRARLVAEAPAPVEPGEFVCVTSVEGLTLWVEPRRSG